MNFLFNYRPTSALSLSWSVFLDRVECNHCVQVSTLGSLFGMLFVTVYFSIFVCVLYVLHCAALVRNK